MANIYYEERDYATLTIQNPNAAVYENLTVKIRQGAMPKGVGIYRSEGSTTVFHADASSLKLKSYGAWTVRLLSSSTWIKLGGTSVDASGNHLASLSDSQNILGLNKVISGGSDLTEEWIHFDFKPSGTVSASAVRGGVIEILYNNNLSKHYMYVRQGYAPVQLNTSSLGNVYWSSYNTYGRNFNSNSSPTFMNSPLQVGYMFRKGSNNGINPYSPGWNGATGYSIDGTRPVSYSEGWYYTSWGAFGASASDKWGNSKSAFPAPDGYKSPTNEQASADLQFDFNTSPERGVFGCVYDDNNKSYWGMLVRQMNGNTFSNTGISVFFPTGGSRLGGTYGGALFYGGPAYRDNGNPRYGTHYILEDRQNEDGHYIDVYSNYNNLMGIKIRTSSEITNPEFWNRGYQVRCVSIDVPDSESYPGDIQPAGYTISDAATGYPLAD